MEKNYGEGHDSYENIFGDTIEPGHGCYGTTSNDDKNKRSFEKIVIPGTVDQMETAAFTGMTKLKSVTIPSKVAKVPSYTFAKCTSLSKIKFSKNMKSVASTAFLYSNRVKTLQLSKSK